jgi:tRNA A-37 threonylcarbamoyl transferase component Bud32
MVLTAPTTALELGRLRAADLEQPDKWFTDGNYLYLSSGRRVGEGGMGNVWTVTRHPADGNGPAEPVVCKTFREEFLFLLREDELARRRFDHFERVLEELRQIEHPNVLPVLRVSPIADNWLMVTPLAGESILSLLTMTALPARERVRLLAEGVRGLAALHERGIIHRDFTLNNVLTRGDGAVVFDFDLSVSPVLLPEEERTYATYYQGRILGSPEFSIAPELLDEVLGQEPLSPRIDVYAIGTALFALFTDDSIYGEAPDLASLFYRISEGIVHRRESRIRYPDSVPALVRPIIEACCDREPSMRYADANEVLQALDVALAELSATEEAGTVRRTTGGFLFTQATLTADEVFARRIDRSVTREEFAKMEATLVRHGYLIERALGRVKGHPIYLAVPDPELVALGRFPEENTYRKIVTAIDISGPDGQQLVETWLGRIYPIVNRVRQGYLTALYKVVHERQAGLLLLFSEYVADPRFGTDLADHMLTLEEVFGIGLIVGLSVARLHEHGLAHNNVRPAALVFKGNRDAGRVQPLFVGLVEPSFEKEKLKEDVRNLAQMVSSLIKQQRIDALRPTARPLIEKLRERLNKTATGELRTPTIKAFIDILADGLSVIEPNFDLVRTHGGNIAQYADLLVRHSLYNKLYAVDTAAL